MMGGQKGTHSKEKLFHKAPGIENKLPPAFPFFQPKRRTGVGTQSFRCIRRERRKAEKPEERKRAGEVLDDRTAGWLGLGSRLHSAVPL